MTDKNNSFETVELIKPVSLMQIDASDLADAKDEAKATQVPAKTAGKIADNAVTVSAATDIDTKTDAGYQADHSAEKILVDPKNLFGNTQASGEKQDYQKHNYAARFFIICVIGLILLLAIITMRSFKDKVEQTGSYSNYNTMLVAPVYTEIEFNADDIDLDLPAIISHKCIEYTDSYNRILFFTANLTEENKGLQIKVEMLDRHGRTLDTHSNSSFGVAAGDEFMIPVFFTLSPDWNLDGVTYKISAETFTEEERGMLRTITDVTEADKGHLFITYESSAYYNMDTYVVLYKNGKVVDVLRGYGDVDDTGKAVAELYKEGVDYDNFKVYY
jgi:hypothetical protein